MQQWSVAFCLALGASWLATLAIVWKLFRNGNLQLSALRFILFCFFSYATLWSLCRFVFFVALLAHCSTSSSTSSASSSATTELLGENTLHQLRQEQRYDAMGMRAIADADTITSWPLSVVLILGDTFLIGTTAWLFPMTHELFLLARVWMDRGERGEKLAIRRYFLVVHTIVVSFLIVQTVDTIGNGGYDGKTMYLAILGQCMQVVGLVYITGALVLLKWKGREYEHVHGRMVPSPLYLRIKNLMIVFSVFSLQYQVISIIHMCGDLDLLPTWLIGISTLLFRSIGLALAFVIGCSQEFVVHNFHRFLPKEYTEAFKIDCMTVEVPSAPPPEKNPVFVFTDIESSSALWAIGDGSLMRIANELHDDILRSLLMKYRGYEITTVGDAFQLAFDNIKDAVEYCMEVQLTLLTAKWPKGLRECGVKATRRERVRGKCIFDGLRVRMGIHDANEEVEGALVVNEHPVTGKVTYTGLSEVIANEVGDYGCGGQIIVTGRVAEWLKNQEPQQQEKKKSLMYIYKVEEVGRHRLRQLDMEVELFQLLVEPLQARKRFFVRKVSSATSGSLELVVDNEEAEQVGVDQVDHAYHPVDLCEAAAQGTVQSAKVVK